jgi:hypothetical protein
MLRALFARQRYFILLIAAIGFHCSVTPVFASSLWGANWGGYLYGYPLDLFQIDRTTGGILSTFRISGSESRAGVLDFASDPIHASSVIWSLHNTMPNGYELLSYDPYAQSVLSRVHLDNSLELQALAIDPTTGVFYSTSTTALYRLNPATGQALLIGATTLAADGALGCDLNGHLFGVRGYGTGPVALLSLNKSTGEATAIAEMAAQPADIAVRPEDDVMYGLGYGNDPNSTYSLYQINPQTAAITDLGPSVFRPAGLAFTNVPEPRTLAFSIIVTPLVTRLGRMQVTRYRASRKDNLLPARL